MSQPNLLDVANFRLKAFQVAGELQLDLLKARADYQLKMMQALERRMKIELDGFELKILQDAYRDLTNTRRADLAKLRILQARAKRQEVAIRRIGMLMLGEMLSGYQCVAGWRGFFYLASQAPVVSVIQFSTLVCESEDRQAMHFYCPARAQGARESAPAQIRHSLALLDWARNQRLIPRIGSPPAQRLSEVVQVMAEGGEELRKDTARQLLEVQESLRQLREANWEQVSILLEKDR